MWKLAPVRVWYRYDIVISYRVYMNGHFMSAERDCDAQVTPYWIGCRRMRVRYPFQTPRRVISPISCWSEQPYRVYMTSEWVFVPEWKSRPGTVTGVNSHQYDSLWYVTLCWYHVNEYRATRGNWSELVPEWKSRRYHVNTPLVQEWRFFVKSEQGYKFFRFSRKCGVLNSISEVAWTLNKKNT